MSRLLVLFVTIISCGTDTPLGEYVPSSDQEAAVKAVLLDFQVAVNLRDADKVADVIHENATLILGRERKPHTKSDYIKILPRRLADQPPLRVGRVNLE